MPPAEHVHLLVNHIPIIGLAFAILPIAWGLIRRDRRTAVLGAILAVLATLPTPLVVWSGKAAEERLHLTLDPDATITLAPEHEERAETTQWALYATLALAASSLVVSGGGERRARLATALLGATLAAAIAGLALAAWTAEAGGRIRHTELRTGAPSVPDGSARPD
jgi:phosphotransferase system  glucose/maltose/N-acetylglucosamine-specific IIC component